MLDVVGREVLMAKKANCVNSRAMMRLRGDNCSMIVISGLSGSDTSIMSGVRGISKVHPTFRGLSYLSLRKVSGLFAGCPNVGNVVRFTTDGTINRSMRGPLLCCHGGLISLVGLLRLVPGRKMRNVVFSSSYAICNRPSILPMARRTPVGGTRSPCNGAGRVGRRVVHSAITSKSPVGTVVLHCFGPVNTRPATLVNRLPGKIPRGLLPCIARATVNVHRGLDIFKSSCSAPSNSYVHSCVCMISLTGTRIVTVSHVLGGGRGRGIRIFGVKANGNISMLRLVGAFRGTANIGLGCRVINHHTKSVRGM